MRLFSMDALAQYETLFADTRVRALLSEMIAAFRQIDVEKSSLQTHATLSALRGILRLCEAEPRMRNCSRLQKKCSRTMCSTE